MKHAGSQRPNEPENGLNHLVSGEEFVVIMISAWKFDAHLRSHDGRVETSRVFDRDDGVAITGNHEYWRLNSVSDVD